MEAWGLFLGVEIELVVGDGDFVGLEGGNGDAERVATGLETIDGVADGDDLIIQ